MEVLNPLNSMLVIFLLQINFEIEQTNVLHNANLAESQEGMQLDILASSEVVRQAVKRYFEPDDQPANIKKSKKPTADTNRQIIPKLSPGLQAKFSRLPSAGSVLSIDSGKITPWNTYPQSSHGGSSSSTANPNSQSEVVPASGVVPKKNASGDQIKQDVPMDEDG